MSDVKELARRAASGDQKAFEGLYEQTKSGVWFTCMGLLRNEENAKDIMQETYITALEKLSSLPNFDGIQNWLNRVAANKCRDYLRASSLRQPAEESEETIEDIPDDALLPEEYVMDKAKRAIIMDIIENKLSEAQSRTIILYYFDELTAAEIAELMGCHEKTVLYRLKTARLKIKQEVLRYEEENSDRLHAIVPIPILTLLLRAAAENTAVPQNIVSFENNFPNPQTAPSNSAAAAASTGGKTMLHTLKAKIIAGACAAVVVGGGVTAGVLISNNSNKKPETSITSSPNVSKPSNASKPQTNTSKPETSNPATSTPVSTDKVVYPEFEGLEPYKFISRIKGVNQPDTVSGNIKEMRHGDRAFILLTNDNEVVMFRGDGYKTKVSYGIDPNITTLENTSYDYLNGEGFLAVNGNYITYKALDSDGNIYPSKQGNPRSFSGNMDFGDRITKVVVSKSWKFYGLDAEGLGVKLSHKFWKHSESEISRFDKSMMDGDYVYYYSYEDREWGFDVGGVKVKEFAGDYCLTDEGKMFNHNDKEPLDFLNEYTFKDIYYNSYSDNGIITGLTEDGKLVVFDAVNKKVKFSGELPDGELKDIWQNSDRVIVKTDKGVFVHEFENDAGFSPIKALNGIDEEVIYISGKYVLLGNGFMYTIDELS